MLEKTENYNISWQLIVLILISLLYQLWKNFFFHLIFENSLELLCVGDWKFSLGQVIWNLTTSGRPSEGISFTVRKSAKTELSNEFFIGFSLLQNGIWLRCLEIVFDGGSNPEFKIKISGCKVCVSLFDFFFHERKVITSKIHDTYSIQLINFY